MKLHFNVKFEYAKISIEKTGLQKSNQIKSQTHYTLYYTPQKSLYFIMVYSVYLLS